ncbi:MAG: PEGA domain-containing protein [Patescibacteria group bacterium]
MYRAPFHRRILPWIFAIVFFVSAPALVFYTSGYRWNPKKEKIERNGTLIVDSTPGGARVLLNGRDTGETTPVTMQNVAPGHYDLRVERDGYSPWEKQLDVYPEYVTFANSIKLWKTSTLTPFTAQHVSSLEASPNDSFVAGLVTNASSSEIFVWQPDGTLRTHRTFTERLSPASLIEWSPDSRALLVESPTTTGMDAWVITIRAEAAPTALPTGNYLWDGTSVRGISGHSRIRVSETDGSFTRTDLGYGIHDVYGDVTLRDATGTENLVLFQSNAPTRGLILPPGEWRIAALNNKMVVLRDGNNWISLNPDENAPSVHRVQGDRLRSFVTRQKTTYLLVSGGELWSWDPASDPELLLRQSQRINDASWDETGRSVLFATDGQVAVLDLDPRDGRLQTQLAALEHATDFALIKKLVLVSGTKDGQPGMWSVEVE